MYKKQSSNIANPYRKPGLQVEKKNYDDLDRVITTPASRDFTTFSPIFIPQLGSAPVNRIGRKTIMKSLYVRGYWTPASVLANLRVIVYYDKQCNGATPAITDALTGVTPNFNSFSNLANSERFIVIADDIFNSGNENQAPGFFQIYRKLNLDSVFNDTQTTPNTGGLFISFSDNGSLAQSVNYSTRVRFTDV